MRVLTLDVPHLGNRTHLVHDGRVGVVIDPPRDLALVESAAARARVDIVAVAETHIHNDYLSGGLRLSRRHGAEYLVAADEEVEFDRIGVRDNETLAFGDIDLRVIATPGHTPLHVSYLATDASQGGAANDEEAPGALFSGGSLLHGTVGRTDLIDPTLTTALARAQWLTARRLGALPRETSLHPTHGFGSFCASSPAVQADEPVTIADQRGANTALTTTRDTFVTELLEGLGPVPSHYAHMAARNRSGPWTPRPASRLQSDYALDALARGAHVVDIRSSTAYAERHLRGALSIPAGPQCAVYAGWVTPWGAELVFVSDSEQDLDALESELASIGIEGVATAVLTPGRGRDWSGLRRTDWAAFAEQPPPPTAVVLDVRRPDEWRGAHLPGALNIAVHELPRRLRELPSGEVWVHCAAGYRAAVAAGVLDRAGRDVVLVDDDFAKVAELGIRLVRENRAA
jgi:hydroxyacylglutathione hydrolase